MPTVTIQANHNLRIRYRVPNSRCIQYHVEAERPVTTYVVNDEGLERFLQGKEVSAYYGGFPNRHNHDEKVQLPSLGWVTLVIVNTDRTSPVAVHYEVLG